MLSLKWLGGRGSDSTDSLSGLSMYTVQRNESLITLFFA